MNDALIGRKTRFETSVRVYNISTNQEGNAFWVNYQVKNKKTGRPWQARRHITDGQDGHLLSNHNDDSMEVRGGLYPNENWNECGKWTGACNCYLTYESAFAALQSDIEKTVSQILKPFKQ